MRPGVPTDGVWLLDYRAGKLLGTLIDRGLGKIIGKMVEECGELCAELVDGTRERIISECADLFYHTLVGLAAREVDPSAVLSELARRHAEATGLSPAVPTPAPRSQPIEEDQPRAKAKPRGTRKRASPPQRGTRKQARAKRMVGRARKR